MAELNISVSRYGWRQLYWIETVEVVHREMWYAVWEEGQRDSLRSTDARLADRPFPTGLVNTDPRWP